MHTHAAHTPSMPTPRSSLFTPLSLTASPTLGHNHLFFLTHTSSHTLTPTGPHIHILMPVFIHSQILTHSPSTPHNMLTHTFTLISDHPHFLTGTLTLLLIHSHTFHHVHSHTLTPRADSLPDSQAFCLSHSLMSMFF